FAHGRCVILLPRREKARLPPSSPRPYPRRHLLFPKAAAMTAPAPKPLKIDFVSDVMCPWCAVGLGGLEQALERLEGEGIAANIAFQPFELNPDIAPEGENMGEHLARKYGSTPEQSAANRAAITA